MAEAAGEAPSAAVAAAVLLGAAADRKQIKYKRERVHAPFCVGPESGPALHSHPGYGILILISNKMLYLKSRVLRTLAPHMRASRRLIKT